MLYGWNLFSEEYFSHLLIQILNCKSTWTLAEKNKLGTNDDSWLCMYKTSDACKGKVRHKGWTTYVSGSWNKSILGGIKISEIGTFLIKLYQCQFGQSVTISIPVALPFIIFWITLAITSKGGRGGHKNY